MADPIDQAQKHAVYLTESAVESARGNVPDGSTWGPERCEECGDFIPEGRRKLGYRVCLDCAQ